MSYANSKGAGQSVHLYSLISALTVRSLVSKTTLIALDGFFSKVGWPEHCLHGTASPKSGFLMTWPKWYNWSGEGIKSGTNARNPGPKSGTKFCQQNISVKHACIELKFGLNVDYRLFFEMHISIFLHLPYFYYMQVKYRTMSWNTDPGPAFSVLTMSRNS